MNRPLDLKTRLMMGIALALLMAGVFALYLRPEFLMMLADQLWACF